MGCYRNGESISVELEGKRWGGEKNLNLGHDPFIKNKGSSRMQASERKRRALEQGLETGGVLPKQKKRRSYLFRERPEIYLFDLKWKIAETEGEISRKKRKETQVKRSLNGKRREQNIYGENNRRLTRKGTTLQRLLTPIPLKESNIEHLVRIPLKHRESGNDIKNKPNSTSQDGLFDQKRNNENLFSKKSVSSTPPKEICVQEKKAGGEKR